MVTPLDPSLFDLTPGILWLMHCAEGPVPRAAAQAVTNFLPRETQPWRLRWEEDFQAIPHETRSEAARIVGALASDVTLTSTTSSGLVTVAQGYPWRPGDEVVVPLGEFPANVWPWKALAARGVSVRQIPLWDTHLAGLDAWASAPPPAGVDPEARLLAALAPKSRVLSVSWVRFQDGLALDIGRLAAGCRERGVDLVVDGIQGAGTREIDLSGVAAFSSGGHKGLLAPQGLGFLWTAPEFRHRLVPSGSWLSVEEATNFARPSSDFDRDWLADGQRLEAGVPNLVGCVALRESLRIVNQAGVSRLAAYIALLRRRLIAGLARLNGPASRLWQTEAARLKELDMEGRLGAIVAIHHAGLGTEGLGRLLRTLMRRGVYGSVREGYFRIALHGWHTLSDVATVLARMEQAAIEL